MDIRIRPSGILPLLLLGCVLGCASPSRNGSYVAATGESVEFLSFDEMVAEQKAFEAKPVEKLDLGDDYPINYEELIVENMKLRLKDPESATYLFGDSPEVVVRSLSSYRKYETWRVIFLVNSKNSFGGYTGYQVAMAYISHGEVNDVVIPLQ